MPSMPSLHTRSIAGQSFPAQRAATVSSAPSTAARAASRFAGRTGRSSAARSSLRTANWTSWKSAPRVSGSSTSIATGSSRGWSRMTACRKKRYGQAAKCWSAVGEKGRAPS